MAPREGSDPEALLVWHTRQVPAALAAAADAALVQRVRDLEVRVHALPEGVGVRLQLEGPLPPDAADRLRRALAALVDSPLGDLAGAIQWLTPTHFALAEAPGALTLEVTVPWRALVALAEGMRGVVGPAPGQ
jgi:hypothetical protein